MDFNDRKKLVFGGQKIVREEKLRTPRVRVEVCPVRKLIEEFKRDLSLDFKDPSLDFLNSSDAFTNILILVKFVSMKSASVKIPEFLKKIAKCSLVDHKHL